MAQVFHPAPTRANRLFWRIFLTCTGALIGSFLGLCLTAACAWPNIMLAGALGGGALGTVLGLTFSPVMPWTVARLQRSGPAALPPRAIVRLGAVVGAVDGVLAGAAHGQLIGGVCGGLMGAAFGSVWAMLAWRIWRCIRLAAVGIVAAAAVEAGGCLLLGYVVGEMVRDPFVVLILAGNFAVAGGIRLVAGWRSLRVGRREAIRSE